MGFPRVIWSFDVKQIINFIYVNSHYSLVNTFLKKMHLPKNNAKRIKRFTTQHENTGKFMFI